MMVPIRIAMDNWNSVFIRSLSLVRAGSWCKCFARARAWLLRRCHTAHRNHRNGSNWGHCPCRCHRSWLFESDDWLRATRGHYGWHLDRDEFLFRRRSLRPFLFRFALGFLPVRAAGGFDCVPAFAGAAAGDLAAQLGSFPGLTALGSDGPIPPANILGA